MKHPWMQELFHRAPVVFCDGSGVVLGARILGYRIPGRITYADWMWDLAAFGEDRGYSFYFLGGKPGVAEQAANRLKERFRHLRVVGTHHGYFDKSPGSIQNRAVVEHINACRPNILLVGFGMPLQEAWLRDNWEGLNANIGLTGGAVFDYISGQLRRAPKWMQDHSLEWLGRLLIEPRRLWKRYLVGNTVFLWNVALERLRRTREGGGSDRAIAGVGSE